MKKLVLLVFALVLVLSLTACGNNTAMGDGSKNSTASLSSGDSDDNASTKQEEVKDNVVSDGYDKFCQLKIGMTESEVNAILGDPIKVDKAYYYYNITVNGKDLKLEVWISTVSGKVTYINGDFTASEYLAEFADSATDLSQVKELESGKINTYDACVKAFKTPGYLMNVDDNGVKQYFWVNDQGGYMRVTFKADGSVKTYSGVC